MYVYLYNWITMLCTWNIVSQLYFNNIYIYVYFKKDDKPCDIRKLGWVPYKQYYILLPLETVIGMDLTGLDDQRFTGLHLMELWICGTNLWFGFHQDG